MNAELRQLKRRFRRISKLINSSPEQRRLALRLRELRSRISASLRSTQSCAGCAVGCDLPEGRWDGGFCCSAPSESTFTDHELVALMLAGTSARDLQRPRSEQAGCLFRGPRGCSLRPVDRPNACASFLCRELLGELHQRGAIAETTGLIDELNATFDRFVALNSDG